MFFLLLFAASGWAGVRDFEEVAPLVSSVFAYRILTPLPSIFRVEAVESPVLPAFLRARLALWGWTLAHGA